MGHPLFKRRNIKIGAAVSLAALSLAVYTRPIHSFFSDRVADTVVIHVAAPPAPPPPTGPGADIPAGGTFTDNGIIWRVLADNTKTDGTKLIITERVYNFGYIAYWTSNSYTLYENSTLKKDATYGIDKWYNTNASADLKAAAVPYGYKPGANGNENNANYYGQFPWNAAANDPNALTVPDLAGTSGHYYPFALSISECNAYKNMFANGSLLANDGIGNRIWWLRSPGSSSAYAATYVNGAGAISTGAAAGSGGTYTGVGMRVALWVYYGNGLSKSSATEFINEIPAEAIDNPAGETADTAAPEVTEEIYTEETEDTTISNSSAADPPATAEYSEQNDQSAV